MSTAGRLRIYLAGPMSGCPDWNYPAFEQAAKDLRARGLDVVSAHEIAHDDGGEPGSIPHSAYLRADIRDGLMRCDAIALLPGWPRSAGAVAEFHAAAAMGYAVFFYDPGSGLLAEMSSRP